MYQRHATSSTTSTLPIGSPTTRYQQNQQSCQFKRRSAPIVTSNTTTSRRSSSLSSSMATSSSQSIDHNSNNNNDSHDVSFLSLPDVDENYFNKDNGYDDDKYNKRNSSGNTYMSNTSFFVWRILPCVVMLMSPWLPCYYVRTNVNSKRVELESIINGQKGVVTKLDETTAKVKELKLEIEMITKDNELSYQELRRNTITNINNNERKTENLAASIEDIDASEDTPANGGNNEYEKMEEEEEVLVQRIDSLEKGIQKAAQKRINKRYGNGQYRFRVNVRDQEGDLSWFVIETATLVEMPHAIDYFFKMVEQQLWNGLTIVHEPHSLIATASPTTTMDDSNSHTWAGQRFVDANLTHMAFTEHSPTYPPPHHRLYTVAFSGRPGGPGFYISLENELEYAHEQESTFGVIMEGRDILYKFFLRDNDGSKKLLTIESIDILETKRPKNDSNEEL